METIKLKEGWLARQMEEISRESANWPRVMMPLTSINSDLVQKPSPSGQNPGQNGCKVTQANPNAK